MNDEAGKRIPDKKLRASCITADGVTYRPKPEGYDDWPVHRLTKTGRLAAQRKPK